MTSYLFRPSFLCVTEWRTACFGHHFICMIEWPLTCFGHQFVRQNDLHVSAITLYDRMTSYMFRPSFCMTVCPPICFDHHFVWQNDLLHVSAIILFDRMTYVFRSSVLCMTERPHTCLGHHFVWQNDLLHVPTIILCDRLTSYMFRPSFFVLVVFVTSVILPFMSSPFVFFPPWGWSRGWPKHVRGHCVYKCCVHFVVTVMVYNRLKHRLWIT